MVAELAGGSSVPSPLPPAPRRLCARTTSPDPPLRAALAAKAETRGRSSSAGWPTGSRSSTSASATASRRSPPAASRQAAARPARRRRAARAAPSDPPLRRTVRVDGTVYEGELAGHRWPQRRVRRPVGRRRGRPRRARRDPGRDPPPGRDRARPPRLGTARAHSSSQRDVTMIAATDRGTYPEAGLRSTARSAKDSRDGRPGLPGFWCPEGRGKNRVRGESLKSGIRSGAEYRRWPGLVVAEKPRADEGGGKLPWEGCRRGGGVLRLLKPWRSEALGTGRPRSGSPRAARATSMMRSMSVRSSTSLRRSACASSSSCARCSVIRPRGRAHRLVGQVLLLLVAQLARAVGHRAALGRDPPPPPGAT